MPAFFFALALWVGLGSWVMFGFAAVAIAVMLLGSFAKIRLIEQVNNVCNTGKNYLRPNPLAQKKVNW